MGIEKFICKNFGPIRSVKLDVKPINILIGTTSSGKSTAAKIISIFKSFEFLLIGNTLDFWQKKFADYNIGFPIRKTTRIAFFWDSFFFELTEAGIDTNIDFRDIPLLVGDNSGIWRISNFLSKSSPTSRIIMGLTVSTLKHSVSDGPLKARMAELSEEYKNDVNRLYPGLWDRFDEIYGGSSAQGNDFLMNLAQTSKPLLEVFEPLYFPAERILVSMVGNSILGLLNNNVSLAECIKSFGAEFELARKAVSGVSIGFLNANYFLEEEASWLKVGKNKLRLEQSSSGFQSLIPLMVVLEFYRQRTDLPKRLFVIEEPELNLYPQTQKDLMQHIVQVATMSNARLFITTHSPYILTTLDNLVQAHNAYSAHPEKEFEIEKIIPRSQWLDFDNVSSYFFDKGTCKSTLNHELRTLGSSAIDDVSIEIGKEFDQLTDIQFA